MSMNGLFSCRQMMYKHAAATCKHVACASQVIFGSDSATSLSTV